ncbi:hypothetical protein CUJ83_10955 [Methanocella sp. CWC-04]|uniref:Uncharacterized protein n=1 Tax=Methanooceanicella nereidis TaxID=2052831 RepID=A0AAP2RDI2_9EURY|nr:hypothetical protein [Methanocella sp. CWC-04]MCD1295518.1 hypothetical protein [Methanocella sp. CWC-04]
MKREYWLVLAFAGLLLMMPLGWLSFALLLLLPGLSVFLLLKKKFSAVELAASSFTLSILIFPLTVFITSMFAMHTAPYLLGIFVIATGLYKFNRNDGIELDVNKNEYQVMAVAAFIFIVVLLISLKMFAVTDNGLICATTHASDLNFHLSISQHYITSPAIPPQDPYLPGTSITYQWLMHVLFGEMGFLTGVDLFVLIKILIPLVSALIFLDTYLLARAVFNSDVKAAFTGAIVYVFSSGLSWAYMAYQTIQGIQPDVFKVLVYDWPGIMNLKYDPASLFFFLPQTQTFGILAMIFGLYLYILTIRERSLKYAVVAGLVLASLVFFHMITAFPVFITLGLYYLYIVAKEKKADIAIIAAIPLLLGGIAGLYQVGMLTESAGSQIILSHHKDVAVTLLVTIGLLVPFALYGMYRLKDVDSSRLLILFAALNFLLLNIVELPMTVNTYRFLVFLALPVALFAGFMMSEWLSSPKFLKKSAAVLIILLMVPSTAILALYYNESSYTHASPGDMKAMYWLKENTPVNAIIYEEPSHFPRIPAVTGRQIAYSGQLYTIQYHNVDRQAEMESLLKMTDPAMLYGKFLEYGVNYVFVGSKESWQPFTSALSDESFFKAVYDRNGVKIYEVLGSKPIEEVNNMDISSFDWLAFAAAFIYLLVLPGANIMRTLGWNLKKYNVVEYIVIAFGLSIAVLTIVSLLLALPFSIGINFYSLIIFVTLIIVLTSKEVVSRVKPDIVTG